MIYRPADVLYSVMDTFDTKTTFNIILNFFDPFKSKNLKPKVLDMSNSYYWNNNIDKFNVIKTNNIKGYAKEDKYNIIIYEPPRNKKFYCDSDDHSSMFFNLLYKNGIVIVKINDFRYAGKLNGYHDIIKIFENNGFYLFDNIIYKHNNTNDDFVYSNHSKIIHSNFLIFKSF